MTMKVIDLKNVQKIYAEDEIAVKAVDGVTLSFDEA